jgi:hypothetical protein
LYRAFVVAVILLIGYLISAPAQSPSPAPSETAFTDRTASTLLRQLSEALQGHSEKKFLALFDLQKMNGGQLFKQQISALLSHSESIRVHLNLLETDTSIRVDKPVADGAMAVEAEMEVQPAGGGAAWRRSERLVFTVVRAGRSWKFDGISPNSFFSLP